MSWVKVHPIGVIGVPGHLRPACVLQTFMSQHMSIQIRVLFYF